jgi:hypothetical protein
MGAGSVPGSAGTVGGGVLAVQDVLALENTLFRVYSGCEYLLGF